MNIQRIQRRRNEKFRARWWMYGLVSLGWVGIAAWGIASGDAHRIVAGLIGGVGYSFIAGLLVFYRPEANR